tara:strand:+ start:753 stop:1580 length:828 start_codon:yes stop_codon:yes gene_type:complete
MLENILKDSGFDDINFKDVIRDFFIDMYQNCKPNFFVTILSIIQTTILLCLIIHAIIFRKSNKEKQRIFTISGIGQYSNNPIKLNIKTIMMLFFSTLSCIFYYLTLDLLCKTTKKYKYIAWFFSIIILMNFITQYMYFMALIIIFGAMIFYIYKTNNNEDIKELATLSGGVGIALLSIKLIGKTFDIFNKKVKDKNINKFWKNINKYVNNGECQNDEYCKDTYDDDYICGENNMCENTELDTDEQANFEAERIMALLGLDDEGSVGHSHDHSHNQ